MDEWCPQQGLNKPQYTKCENVTNGGNTCVNPEIKYGYVEGGIPREHQNNDYVKWCDQLGGSYDSYTLGSRTGFCVFGSTHFDDDIWHWADCRDGFWYNQALGLNQGRSDYITSITCDNSYGKFIHLSNIFEKGKCYDQNFCL